MKIENPFVYLGVHQDAKTEEKERMRATQNVLRWFHQIDAEEEIVPFDKPSQLLALMIDAKGDYLNRNELLIVREMCA